MAIPFPPDGPQVQAALQKVPTPQLQQYAAGQPPQPTGQVTPGPMGAAAGALNQRGAMAAASQRQTAMQNNPENSPTIFQQLMMKEQMVNQQAQAIQQQAQAVQQKEQQLGVAGAMMAKKARDLAERERGIAQLPMRPDMFTAMNGGIVFSGGGGVEGYAQRGLVQRDLGAFNEDRSSVGVPSTTGEPDPAAAMDVVRELLASSKRVAEAGQKAILSEEDQAKRRKERTDEMAAEFAEYEKGRSGREERMAQALRGKDPEVLDFLMAMAAGGPGKTLAETLSRMVPGAAKLRVEQQAREMAAAKYLAEAEEKAAQAQLAEKRGQRAAADKFLQDEQALRLKGFEILKGVNDTGIRALASVQEAQDRQASEAARRKEAAERQALALRKYEEAPERARAQAEYEAKLAKAGRGGTTDLQTRANVAYEVLKEENAKLPPDQRKSDAQLRDKAYGLAENALLGSRRTSAAASMLRAEVFNSKTLTEAMNRLRYDPVYNEASATEKRELEDAVRARFPASRDMSPGAIPYPERSNAPPPGTVLKFDAQGNPTN